jgi:hypothetical protein
MFAKIALSVAMVVGTASGVFAATKHSTARHHGPVVQSQVQADAYGAYASASRKPAAGQRPETGAILIQDRDNSFAFGGSHIYCDGRC